MERTTRTVFTFEVREDGFLDVNRLHAELLREIQDRQENSRREPALDVAAEDACIDSLNFEEVFSRSITPMPRRVPLGLFRWLCRGETRAIVDQTRDDLRRDARAMMQEGRSVWTVRAVIWWRSIYCMATITGPGLVRIVKFLLDVRRLFSTPPPSIS